MQLLLQKTAQLIADGNVVGWYQGKDGMGSTCTWKSKYSSRS